MLYCVVCSYNESDISVETAAIIGVETGVQEVQ